MRKFRTLILLPLAWLMSTTAQAASPDRPHSTPFEPLAEGEIECHFSVNFNNNYVLRTGPGDHYSKANTLDDEGFDWVMRRNGDWFMVVGNSYYWVHKADITLYEWENNSGNSDESGFANEQCTRGVHIIYREKTEK